MDWPGANAKNHRSVVNKPSSGRAPTPAPIAAHHQTGNYSPINNRRPSIEGRTALPRSTPAPNRVAPTTRTALPRPEQHNGLAAPRTARSHIANTAPPHIASHHVVPHNKHRTHHSKHHATPRHTTQHKLRIARPYPQSYTSAISYPHHAATIVFRCNTNVSASFRIGIGKLEPHSRYAIAAHARDEYPDSMKTHKGITSLIQTAESERRCAYSRRSSEQAALRRRAKAGELVNTYAGAPSLYATTEYWRALTPPERTLHIAKALAHAHPQWVFGGLTAASAYGFEHQWRLHDGSVSIMTSTHGSRSNHRRLHHVYAHDAQSTALRHEATGLLLTPPAKTLLDCAQHYDFRFALPMFDSAFGMGITGDHITEQCASHPTANAGAIIRLLNHVNPNSENGGESFARGTMIECGFPTPRIQVPVKDPATGASYRADFVWRLEDGRTVVAEYDGTRKYVDPEMTDNRSVQETIAKERERDAGLKRAGASEVVHFTYEDTLDRTPLEIKLLRAGIPQTKR